jgi:hypothetical protein
MTEFHSTRNPKPEPTPETDRLLHLVGDLMNALGDPELNRSLHPELRRMLDEIEDALYFADCSMGLIE